MKHSKYNSILPLTKRTSMIYNAVTEKFVIFNNNLKHLLMSSPDDIKNAVPSFYSDLKNGGMLVEDEMNEVEQMVSLGKKYCDNSSTFNLIINPTTNCNFNCWYCYETHSSHARMAVETIEKVGMFVNNIIDKDIKSLKVSFFGGEPLLYYENIVRPIIDSIRKKTTETEYRKLNVSYHFTTNGYLVTDQLISHLLEKSETKSFQITLDGHREKHNKVRFSASGRGSYDRIVSNIKKLVCNGMNVGLRINFTKENASSIISILDDFNDLDEEACKLINVDFQKVWQENNISDDDYVVENAVSAFREKFRCVSDHYSHVNTFRYPCYADLLNECVVNYNGDVYKCTARDFIPENRLGYLSDTGEIVWDDVEFVESRSCSRFDKKICKECRIFPICGGGCSQLSVESPDDVCPKHRDELDKDNIILNKFYEHVVMRKENHNVKDTF